MTTDTTQSLSAMIDDLVHLSEGDATLVERLSPGWFMRRFKVKGVVTNFTVPSLSVENITFGVLRLNDGREGVVVHALLQSKEHKAGVVERPLFLRLLDDPSPEPPFLTGIRDAVLALHKHHAARPDLDDPDFPDRHLAIHVALEDRIREAGAALLAPNMPEWLAKTSDVDVETSSSPSP